MKDNRKKEFFICCIAELKTLEMHFSDMAVKGWMIDKIKPFFYEYKRIDPQELQFFVDMLPQITAFDYPENDDAQEYRRMCEESGWRFVTFSKQIQLFYTEKKKDMPMPIHTDKKIEAKIMLDACRKYELIVFFIVFAYLMFICGGVIGKGYNLFLSNISMAQAIAVIVFTPIFLWYFGFICVWYFRTMIRVKKELPVPKVDYKMTRIRSMLFNIAAIIAIVVMIAGVGLEICGGAPSVIFFTSLLPIAGLFIGLFIRKQIDEKKREKKTNIRLFIMGMVTIVIVSIVTNAFVIANVGQDLSDVQSLPEDRTALTLTDIGIKTPPNVYNYYKHDSIAVPLNYTYYEISKEGSVHTEVKKAISGRLANGIFQNLFDELNEQEWRSLTEMNSGEAESWGAAEGYYLDSTGTNLLLLYEKTILQIEYSGDNIQSDGIREKVKSMGRM